jgi:hypothetical protein
MRVSCIAPLKIDLRCVTKPSPPSPSPIAADGGERGAGSLFSSLGSNAFFMHSSLENRPLVRDKALTPNPFTGVGFFDEASFRRIVCRGARLCASLKSPSPATRLPDSGVNQYVRVARERGWGEAAVRYAKQNPRWCKKPTLVSPQPLSHRRRRRGEGSRKSIFITWVECVFHA